MSDLIDRIKLKLGTADKMLAKTYDKHTEIYNANVIDPKSAT